MKKKYQNFREELLQKGTNAIREELESSVKFSMGLREKFKLDPTKVISDNLVVSSNMPNEVKKQIEDFKINCKKLIAGIAYMIEKEKFEDIDTAIENLDLLNYQKDKVKDLHIKQKKISYSLQTLNILVEVFVRLNEQLKEEIQLSYSDIKKNLQLRIKNAILVYELTSFVTSEIESFSLQGRSSIESIKRQVFDNLSKNKDKEQKLNLYAETEIGKELYKNKIKEYQKIRNAIKSKWNELDNKLDGMEKSVNKIKAVLPRLYNVKTDAEIQLDLLGNTYITRLINSNIEIAETLPENLENLLIPYHAEDACRFLGLKVDMK